MSRRMFGYIAALFFALSAVFLPVAAILEYKDRELQRSEILSQESSLADVAKTIMSQKTARLVSDLLYITDSLRNYRNTDEYAALQQDWTAFANRKKVYDQIRYLDASGREVVRVNYAAAGAYAVAQSELQDKSDRYYFTDTIGLPDGSIYISKMDLNQEGDTVEQPIKPMIRLAAPYYDAAGVCRGIVVLNYYANDILSQLKEVSSTSRGEVYLLNEAGYWLYDSADSGKEWGFMYADRQDVSFAAAYPAEWQALQQGAEQLTTDRGLFHATRIFAENDIFSDDADYSLVLGDGDFLLVSRLPADTPDGRLFTQGPGAVVLAALQKNGVVFLLLFLLACMLGVFLEMRRRERDEIRYFSEYDTMTGLYNRRAGFEKLQQIYQEARRAQKPVSLCFVDINGLKEVNDHLGHEAGDELILNVVAGFRACLRRQDIAARLGGDEFLLVLRGLDADGAEALWACIAGQYAEMDRSAGRRYRVSASHGIEAIGSSALGDIDLAVNRADQKMYEEKRRIKQNFSVLR